MRQLIRTYIDVLVQIQDLNTYDECIEQLKRELYQRDCSTSVIEKVIKKSRYISSVFSTEASLESMKRSRDSLVDYLSSLLAEEERSEPVQITYLNNYLKNFYSFVEAFRETAPHRKATLSREVLEKVSIANEYDLQHLLYAALKPLWPDARMEVVEDTGYSFVRVDIKIPSIKAVIETRSTRKTMTVKALQEQVAADCFHYDTEYLFIFIYDSVKMIRDKGAFEKAYTRADGMKNICTIVLQPVIL